MANEGAARAASQPLGRCAPVARKRTMNAPTARLFAAAFALCAGQAWAQTAPLEALARPSLYLQAAHASHGTEAWTLGTTLPFGSWQRSLGSFAVRGYWDLYLSQLSADGPAGPFRTHLVGATPSFRLVPDGGRARWFFDAGIGATVANRRYVTLDKEFSTRFNFASHIGIGMLLGAQHQHELQLRLQHVSNAGIKEPNPGENFLQLRYALRF